MPCSVSIEELHRLTVVQLKGLITGAIPTAAHRTKIILIEYIRHHWDDEIYAKYLRILEDDATRRRRYGHLSKAPSYPYSHATSYMELPSDEERLQLFKDFYQATSNFALARSVCAVCARELNCSAADFSRLHPNNIPNPERLYPHNPHQDHFLVNGMLVEQRGVFDDILQICSACLADLRSCNTGPPKFSLANDLWIGDAPAELTSLTVPEQKLIALIFPRVFVYQLFPRRPGADPETLQRGMKGTVCSYPMNISAISDMISGNIMPRPPEILASVISVTFVGSGTFPKKWLKKTFRVRRGHIRSALLWLKANNQRYYGNIDVSEERLSQLPEDDVPVQITNLLRRSKDVSAAVSEHSGYASNSSIAFAGDNEPEEDGDDEADTPDVDEEGNPVFPILASGMADNEFPAILPSELLQWAMENITGTNNEGWYGVRHGRQPVRDLGPRGVAAQSPDVDFDYWVKAFPTLFPRGIGGPQSARQKRLFLDEHIRWLLEHADHRFRCHESFIFVAFSIIQKRAALDSAKLEMRQSTFDKDAQLLSSITLDRLKKAVEKEARHEPITDPAVNLLKKHVHAAASRVIGSDDSRQAWRSQIWSTSLIFGPPTLWLTINPSDLHDPIPQIFVGEDIDMDHFLRELGPDSHRRAINIAKDPFASATFFRFIITAVLQTLFGIKATSYRIDRHMGVLGEIGAYFGAVESQGRGTLHLHMMLWLQCTPKAETIKDLLSTEEFRGIVTQYIETNIRAYLPGLENSDSIRGIPICKDVAYNRPPDPSDQNYGVMSSDFELNVVRTEQLHTCRPRQCLKPDSHGRQRCKRRAPWPKHQRSFINEKGEWAPKRLYEYMNQWNPPISICIRCNNDMKLLTNGRETTCTTFYVTNYSSKKQGDHSLTAIMAEGYEHHLELDDRAGEHYVQSLQDRQRQVIFRLVHAINHLQELAAPMVTSYLMKYGDTFQSHRYTPIYWSAFVKMLYKCFPQLKKSWRCRNESEVQHVPIVDGEHEREDDHNDEDHKATLEMGNAGLVARSHFSDYAFRAYEFESMNILEYFMETYEDDIGPVTFQPSTVNGKSRGRPRKERYLYLDEHPLHSKKHRIRRSSDHNTLPNFIGRQFPDRNDEDSRPLYAASMLMLLKPWRKLEVLKAGYSSWEDAFDAFLATSSNDVQKVVSGIQYFHECRTAAAAANDVDEDLSSSLEASTAAHEEMNDLDDLDEDTGTGDGAGDVQPSKQDLEALLNSQTPPRERLHGVMAVEIARFSQFLPEAVDRWDTISDPTHLHNAEGSDISNFEHWMQTMGNSACEEEINCDESQVEGSVDAFERGDVNLEGQTTGKVQYVAPEEGLLPADVSSLNEAQRRAYNIVTWHLDQSEHRPDIPPLRMFLEGEGGTGKSKVIQTITETFKARNLRHTLVKSAYTGVAASLVSGKTTHSIAGISGGKKGTKQSQDTRDRLEVFWRDKRYLIIDEVSMIGKSFLADLSKHIGAAKGVTEDSEGNLDNSFGNVNVIIAGDFHQFPPVAVSPKEALYREEDCCGVRSEASQVGRAIYKTFTTVVRLTEQIRVKDPEWMAFLRRLRVGQIMEDDIKMLKSLVLSRSDNNIHTESAWENASLVTPRHAVRAEWNSAALRNMCQKNRRQLFVVPAEDSYKGRHLTPQEEYSFESRFTRGRSKSPKRDLPRTLEVAIGMKVMVTTNVDVDLDIANGARGTIEAIIFHPDEPSHEGPQITLQYPPLYLLVKLSRTRSQQLPGLPDRVIPVEPATVSYQISTKTSTGKLTTKTIKRRQFPLTAAYAFTDYRAQGQTLEYVIVDIASPPSGSLSLFNLYVALSRSSGRDTIRLLRDFDVDVLMKGHHADLLAEDDRISRLDEVTKNTFATIL